MDTQDQPSPTVSETPVAPKKKEGMPTPLLAILLVVGLIVVYGVFKAITSDGSGSSDDFLGIATLHGTVSFSGTQFVITNQDNYAWTNVILAVNDDYELTVESILPGTHTVRVKRSVPIDQRRLPFHLTPRGNK